MPGFGNILSSASQIGGQLSSIGSAAGINTSGLNNALSSLGQLQSAMNEIFGLIENSGLVKGFKMNGGSMVLDFREDPHYDDSEPTSTVTNALSGVNDTINQVQSAVYAVDRIRDIFGN